VLTLIFRAWATCGAFYKIAIFTTLVPLTHQSETVTKFGWNSVSKLPCTIQSFLELSQTSDLQNQLGSVVKEVPG